LWADLFGDSSLINMIVHSPPSSEASSSPAAISSRSSFPYLLFQRSLERDRISVQRPGNHRRMIQPAEASSMPENRMGHHPGLSRPPRPRLNPANSAWRT